MEYATALLKDFADLRLLYAEDDPDAVVLFSRQLLRCRAKAKHAPNGAVAIEYLTRYTEAGAGSFTPQAIFLDIKMPLKSGFDVLTWMRGYKAFDHTAAVILSSSDEPSDIAMARTLGANAYFEKFPKQDDLIKLLSAIASLRAPIRKVLLSEAGLLKDAM